MCPITPNHTWVGDFTYLRFKSKFLYLATFMDLFTREIVGWHISRKHTKNLVIKAFVHAMINRKLKTPLIIHTDQGVEYTSKEYTTLMSKLNIHNKTELIRFAIRKRIIPL